MASLNRAGMPRTRPWVALAALFAVYTIGFIERQVVALLAEPIRLDLGLSDTQLGLLTGLAFALFYTAFGLPVARLADRRGRVAVIALSCAVSSVFTALSGAAMSFWQLVAARIGVGVGEAGGSPPSFSLIADFFPAGQRATATAVYTLGTPVGLLLGSLYAGWVASTWGWRWAFVAVAIPSALAGLMLWLTVREPAPAADLHSTEGAPTSIRAVLRLYLVDPVLRWLALAAGVSAMVGWAVLNWAPAYLMRVHGMTLAEVALWFSPAIALGMTVGILGSGIVTDRLAARSVAANAWVPAAGFALAAPLFVGALMSDDWRWTLALLVLPCGLFMVYVAPTFALLQQLVPSDARSIASAAMLFTMNIVGMGGGPLLVGVLSDTFGATQGAEGLRQALLWLSPLFLVAALAHWRVARLLLGRRPTAAGSLLPLDAQAPR